MPSLESLMKRLGFVRLARYGLVLTPEGRIMSLRPVILDDGLGGRIVGWPDHDLAAMELQKWEPVRPAPQTAVATRLAVPASPANPDVAQPADSDEDEWEWEIALARARAAAEEVEQAAASARAPRARPNTIPPPLTVVQIPPRRPTEPIATIEFEDRTQPSSEIVKVARIAPRPVLPPVPPPTVIPIPKLPSIKDRASQIQPVVSPAVPVRPSRTRLAQGTGPVVQARLPIVPPLPSIKRVTR